MIVIGCSLYQPSREGMGDRRDEWNGRDESNRGMGRDERNGGINEWNNESNRGMGIQQSEIPEGDEDLYMLKSQMVPPVCPRCPDAAVCPREKPCPSCPPCARCPEPAFSCKKVPNYTSQNQTELPLPMLNTFASFR